MKLWLISQDENGNYDTFDSAVVAAKTEEEARNTHPGGGSWDDYLNQRTWASSLSAVTVEYLGTAKPKTEAGVILASFNAG